jgi:pimeloyl-ACP methyl ester carboxylesterase
MPYSTEDIFILLPGITGSVLAKDNKEVWGPSAGSILKALLSGGASVAELQLSGDDPDKDDLQDGVTATRLVPDVTLIPGFWKIDGYTAVAESLIEHFGLQRGVSFFDFPYDWRRHNAVAARKLQRRVHDWLKVKKQAGASDPKAVLVAHSMGGLVCRHFLEVLGGWRQTRALVTFGTPYRGSLNSLGYLANGFKMAGLDLTSLLRTLTSTYELLPIYPCVSTGGTDLARVAEMPGLPQVDADRAKAALDFHRKIESEQKLNATLPGYGYKIVPLIGFEQPTMQTARYEGGKLELVASRLGKDESGDGTVPRISATPIEIPQENGAVFACERHGSLQNNAGLLAHVRGALTQPVFEGVVRAFVEVADLTVTVEDAYRTGDVIEIGVAASEGEPEIEAVLQDAVTNAEIERQPVKAGGLSGQRVIFDPVPAGYYRFTLSGPKVSPVTDVFLVAG